ncbi:YeeE/YedE thiosulfate transporter family protein, partial [Saccharomonospora iraqiensis]|uniref:YeeE/YedE thiosulfate transporter family protein n=1 Tax=Saccharomonospora iraqiensis TaxID=52698 RepID=UPI00022E1273
MRLTPLVVSGLLAAGSAWYVWAVHGRRFVAVLLIGVFLGIALFHSRFGFGAMWRQMLAVGNGAGIRAHALLFATAATLIMLIVATGVGLFGATPTVAARPIGLPLFTGAVLSTAGMQLAGACSAGILYTLGAGRLSLLLVLGGFIAGSVFYTWAFPIFDGWPEVPGLLLADQVGWGGAWASTLGLLLGAVVLTRVAQARRAPPPRGPA